MLSTALVPLATLFALLALGFVARRAGWLTDAAESALNRFAYAFAFPAIVFASLWRAPIAAITDARLYAVGLAAILGSGALAFVAARLFARAARARAALVFVVLFANTAFLGLPLVSLALGASAIGPAAAIVGLSLAVPVPIGIALTVAAGHERGARRAATRDGVERARRVGVEFARSPILWAAVAGVVGAFARDRYALPSGLGPIDLLGASATPVALFALGAFLAGAPRAGLLKRGGLVGVVAFLKLVVAPAIAFALAGLTTLPAASRGAVLIESAVPTGVSTFTITRELGGDAEFAAACVVATTILSAATLALWLAWAT
ncbi:MAG: AEC family transporter [Thermoplasmatota archaeon]